MDQPPQEEEEFPDFPAWNPVPWPPSCDYSATAICAGNEPARYAISCGYPYPNFICSLCYKEPPTYYYDRDPLELIRLSVMADDGSVFASEKVLYEEYTRMFYTFRHKCLDEDKLLAACNVVRLKTGGEPLLKEIP